MRQLLTALICFVFITSCENIEDNSPALQGEIDNGFFKAGDTKGVLNDDGSFLIQGITANESMNLNISSFRGGLFEFGPGSPNSATFENSAGLLYSTRFGGDGKVRVSEACLECGYISGDFNFMAIRPGVDTIFVDKGFFFRVPFNNGLDELEEPSNAGTFVADIDGITFNPFSITAFLSGDNVVISGESSNLTIRLRFPSDTPPDNYPLPMQFFDATYINGVDSESAISGNIVILENNEAERTVKGVFAFQTASVTISQGQFNVTY